MNDDDGADERPGRLESAGTFVEPGSFEDGKRMLAEVRGQIKDINVQVIERHPGAVWSEDYRAWRKKAMRARWYLQQREEFLHDWVKTRQQAWEAGNRERRAEARRVSEQEAARRESVVDLGVGGPTQALRLLAKRVGRIEAVFHAACAAIDEGTKESWDDLVRAVADARSETTED